MIRRSFGKSARAGFVSDVSGNETHFVELIKMCPKPQFEESFLVLVSANFDVYYLMKFLVLAFISHDSGMKPR